MSIAYPLTFRFTFRLMSALSSLTSHIHNSPTSLFPCSSCCLGLWVTGLKSWEEGGVG